MRRCDSGLVWSSSPFSAPMGRWSSIPSRKRRCSRATISWFSAGRRTYASSLLPAAGDVTQVAPWSRRELKDAARTAAAAVDGWLNETQGEALFDAAARCSGRGAIVEIGSWKGRSTIWLAYSARVAGQRVFAVDPHVNSREDTAARTLDESPRTSASKSSLDVVTPLVMSSHKAASS